MQVSVRRVLSRYATFQGRASRPEYWWWVLASLLFFGALKLIDGLLVAPVLGFDDPWGPEATHPLSVIGALAIFLPNLAVAVRRLHDINRTGWWILIGLIPLVGALILLYYYVQPSDSERNGFGEPDPLPG